LIKTQYTDETIIKALMTTLGYPRQLKYYNNTEQNRYGLWHHSHDYAPPGSDAGILTDQTSSLGNTAKPSRNANPAITPGTAFRRLIQHFTQAIRQLPLSVLGGGRRQATQARHNANKRKDPAHDGVST